MEVETKYDGIIKISESDVITFEDGIPGFEDAKKFVVVIHKDSMIQILQSIEDSNIALPVVNIMEMDVNYNVNISGSIVDKLGIKDNTSIKVLNVLSIREHFEDSTVNLLAPVVINADNMKAKQIISDNNNYGVRHPILDFIKTIGSKSRRCI